VVNGGANAVLMHKGIVGCGHRGYGKDAGLIIHLSTGTTSLGADPNIKKLVTTVEQAVKMGADAVSVHVNVGANGEADMLQDLGMVAEVADEWGMPLLAMMYPRGHDIKNPYDVEVIKIAARAGVDLCIGQRRLAGRQGLRKRARSHRRGREDEEAERCLADGKGFY